MIARSNRRAALLVVSLVIAAVMLLRWSPTPRLGSPYFEELGEGYVTQPYPPAPEASEPEPVGQVRGLVLDDGGAPLQTIEVELIPVDKTGEARWYATKHDWTNSSGAYEFRNIEPGEYFVAVMKRGAPEGQRPFVGVYYPMADNESDADRVLVVASSTIDLTPVRLCRLETVTVKVQVSFEDGTRPSWSNLLFHNISFPNQAVIGDEAPGIHDGRGEFTLPKGFEYDAMAEVDCDTGTRIESRESPVRRIRIEDGAAPDEVMFTIPDPPCKLWSPKVESYSDCLRLLSSCHSFPPDTNKLDT